MTAVEVKYKVGQRVEVTKRNGQKAIGRVDGSDWGVTGQWVAVNFAEKGQNRYVRNYRPSKVRKL